MAKAALEKLTKSPRLEWVTFSVQGVVWGVEVASCQDGFEVNVLYRFKEDFKLVFGRAGIQVPERWTVKEFRPASGFLSSATLLFAVQATEDLGVIGAFVADLFAKLFGTGPNFRLKAVLQ